MPFLAMKALIINKRCDKLASFLSLLLRFCCYEKTSYVSVVSFLLILNFYLLEILAITSKKLTVKDLFKTKGKAWRIVIDVAKVTWTRLIFLYFVIFVMIVIGNGLFLHLYIYQGVSDCNISPTLDFIWPYQWRSSVSDNFERLCIKGLDMYVYTSLLTHFQPMFHFYTPWKHKTGFLMFSGTIEVEHWLNMG